jgi:hypothetical protein
MQALEHQSEQAASNSHVAMIDARNYVVIGDPAARIVLDN